MKSKPTWNVDQETKDDFKFLVKKFLDDANRTCSNRINQSLHCTLSKLSKDPRIKICRFDKGNGVAVFNTEDYYAKLDKIICDKSKFVEIETESATVHPLIQKENSITYYVRKYLNKMQ